MKLFKTIIITLLILSLSVPAFAWRGYGYPRYGYGCGAGAGIGAGIVLVGVLAVLLIGKAVADRSQAELNMLDAAARANQYENYLIALSFYNKNTSYPVTPFNVDQWVQWRNAYGLEALR
jgi:hypothetical protein